MCDRRAPHRGGWQYSCELSRSIVKIRPASLTGEEFGESGEALDRSGRSLPCELPEIADQMRLIVISAIGGDLGPVFVFAFHRAKHLLKPKNPAKKFRAEADFVQKTALQLPAADPQIAG